MTSKQIIIVVLAVILTALLYFAPKSGTEKTLEPEENSSFAADFESAKKNLSAEQKALFDKLEVKRKAAETANDETAWFESASDFLKAARYFQDANKVMLYRECIAQFEKVITLNPNNLSAKTNLGTSIVESSGLLGGSPMQGISMIREVVTVDSLNIEANLQLGLFSVTSRQFDKAIERFQRILRIDSTHIDMYVYLGDTYLSMGEKQKAINSYENYKTRVKDTLITKDIEEYIKKLKQN